MNPIRSALESGAPAFGAWIWYPHPMSAELIAKAGFKWAVLDAQHGGSNWDNLLESIQAFELGGAATVVRIGWIDEAQIMRALDLGAAGVIVPMVSTADDAKRVARAMRYPPEGVRSYGATRMKYATTEEANRDVVALAMIETAEGLENVEAIAATGGIDALFVGPVDLALSIGLGINAPNEKHPKLLEAYDRVVAAARKHGKFVGTLAFSQELLEWWLERGFRFLTIHSDRTYLTRGATADVALAKKMTEKYTIGR